jgi:hypothetical protein
LLGIAVQAEPPGGDEAGERTNRNSATED